MVDTVRETSPFDIQTTFTVQERDQEKQSFDDIKSTVNDVILLLPRRPHGAIGTEFLEALKRKRDAYRALRSAFALERKGQTLSRAKVQLLSELGISTLNVPESSSVIMSELLDCYYSTYRLIQDTDPLKVRRDESQDLGYIQLGAEANGKFNNFFFGLHNRHKLSEAELEKIFEIAFDKAGLTEDLKSRALGFREGVIASLKGYLYLVKTLPGYQVAQADQDTDLNWGVDLIASKENYSNVYQVKSKKAGPLSCIEITRLEQVEEVRKSIVLSEEPRSRRWLRSLYRMYEYASGLNAKGRNARAFYLQVPL